MNERKFLESDYLLVSLEHDEKRKLMEEKMASLLGGGGVDEKPEACTYPSDVKLMGRLKIGQRAAIVWEHVDGSCSDAIYRYEDAEAAKLRGVTNARRRKEERLHIAACVLSNTNVIGDVSAQVKRALSVADELLREVDANLKGVDG